MFFVNWTSLDDRQLDVFHVQDVLIELGADLETTNVKENPKASNGLIIETPDEALGRRLMAVTEVKGHLVQASDTTTDNAVKCVVKCTALEQRPIDQLLAGVRDQGVLNITRKAGKRGTLVLSMRDARIPPVIRFGAIRVKTQLYVPRPMLCRACFCFGHPERQCRNKPACPRCGREHTLDPTKKCTRRQECRNCRGGHPSLWGGCAAWRQEVAIKTLMRDNDIPGAEARARYKAECKHQYFELVRGTKRDKTAAAQEPAVIELEDDGESDSSGAMEPAAVRVKARTNKSPKGEVGPKRKSNSQNSDEDVTPLKKGKGGKKASLSLAKSAKGGK